MCSVRCLLYFGPTHRTSSKMLLERLCFCLTIWAISQAQDLVVSQPSFVRGTEGGSVTMRCSYNITTEPKVGSYWWTKDSILEVKNNTREFLGRVSLTSVQDFLIGRKADIVIQDLRHYDSGMYQCVVHIPGQPEMTGNGTELQVTKPTAAPKVSDNVMPFNSLWIGLCSALVAAAFCSVAAFLLYCYCTRRRDHRVKVSRTERMSQDCELKEDPKEEGAKLNYAELSLKKGKIHRPRKEMVTYASVEMQYKYLE